LWISLVALTALMPGFAAGLAARRLQWSPKHCRRASFLAALSFWLICGGVAQYARHAIPWGWVADAHWERGITQGLWYSAVLIAPLVAQKIANPPAQLRDMRYW